ncbi:MAG: hypothetical protein FJ170_03330, partial [Gammaproteobacteria bacterium]|nr:hypothetical protein [Gammaproteobacteria bacterium]
MSIRQRIGLLVLLACWLPAGQAAIRQIEQALELRPEQLQLPARPDAQLTIRPCATCRVVALQVTAATLWYSGMTDPKPAGQAAVLQIYRTAGSDPRTLV